ncbi:hypothetical protein CUMW_117380 [Citrus unshiu]|nr:hypothetical protein CUMW_117380 [Citrus unshiu]
MWFRGFDDDGIWADTSANNLISKLFTGVTLPKLTLGYMIRENNFTKDRLLILDVASFTRVSQPIIYLNSHKQTKKRGQRPSSNAEKLHVINSQKLTFVTDNQKAGEKKKIPCQIDQLKIF